MILLLGGSGYIGQAFAKELLRRRLDFRIVNRKEFDYTQFEVLNKYVRETKPVFLINCAGYTGKPNVDACEAQKADTLLGNSLFPQMVGIVCSINNIPWGHVSSGCIFSGSKVNQNGLIKIEKNLMRPDLQKLFNEKPVCFQGFTEKDEPNFSFRQPPCSFYSGSKALAEESIKALPKNYIWRLRIPFDEFDNPRNYLSKIQIYPKVYDNINSLSHRGDFVRACIDLWETNAPYGIYNVTNPGAVSTRQVVDLIRKHLKSTSAFIFWKNDEEFYRLAAKTPRSNCILDTSKLVSVGIKIRSVEEALEDALHNWTPEPDKIPL